MKLAPHLKQPITPGYVSTVDGRIAQHKHGHCISVTVPNKAETRIPTSLADRRMKELRIGSLEGQDRGSYLGLHRQ